MDSSHYNSDRTRPTSMSGQGGHSSYNLHAPHRAAQHTSIPSLMHALQHPSAAASPSNDRGQIRRRARAPVSEPAIAVNNDTSSSPFRPLVLSLPQGMSDWNVTDDIASTSTSLEESAPSSSRRTSLNRIRSNTRKRQSGRRLFGALSPSGDRAHAQRQSGPSRTTSLTQEAVNLDLTSSQTNTQQHPYSRSRTTSSLDFTLNNNPTSTSSPRLEIPEHGLHSFKRSFEDEAFTSSGLAMPSSDSLPATSPLSSASSNEDDTPGPSATSLTFSPTSASSSGTSPVSPNNAEEEPSVRQFRSILARFEARLSRNSSTSATSTLTLPPITIPTSSTAVSMPESWLRMAEFEHDTNHQGNEDEDDSVTTTSSAIRHTPPTPEHAGSRIKRRRSRTNGSDSVLLRDEDGASGVTSTSSMRDEAAAGTTSPTDNDSLDGSDDNMANYELDQDMFPDSLELSSHHEHEEAAELNEETDSSVQMDENSIYGSPLDSPSASTPVSVRRGLHRHFSLGALPLFHFEEEEEGEESTPGSGSAHEDVDSRTDATGANLTDSSRRGLSDSIRFRSRLPRRPNLQRNTTAVSPPEESPLNTPEEGDSARDGGSFTRPGLAPWRIPSAATAQPQQANQPQDVAAGEFIPARPLSSQEILQSRHSLGDTSLTSDRLASLHDDPEYRRLSFDFDFAQEELAVHPTMAHSGDHFGSTTGLIHSSSMVPQLNILGSAENANARLRSETQNTNATSATMSSSTSSSSGVAGWHSDAERTRAELLSDQLETSRRIAAEVQSLQTRLTEPTTTPVPQQAHPPAPSPLLRISTSTNVENTRTSTLPPRVSFSSAVGSSSREASGSHREPSQPRSSNHSTRRFSNDPTVQAESPSRQISQPAVFEAPLGPIPRQPLTAFFSLEYRPSHMATADIPYSDAAFWRHRDNNTSAGPSHRYGSLGGTNMRGPTRASNEAWMRAQGIDFYDSFLRPEPARPYATPSYEPFRPRSPNEPLQPPSSRASETYLTRQYQIERRNRAQINRVQEPFMLDHQYRTSSPTSTRPLSPVLPPVYPAHNTLPPIFVASSRSNVRSPAGINARHNAVQPMDRAHTQPDNTFRYPLGPPADANTISRMQRHGRTVSAGHPGVSLSRSGLSGRFTPLPRFSRRTSSPQLDAIRPVSPLLQPANIVNNASRSQGQTSNALTQSLSIPLGGSNAATDRPHENHTSTTRSRTAARSNTGNNSIADWFRGHTNEVPPPAAPSVQTAASEVEEASDGIAAAVRRLDDVRRILDEVSQNIQRRRAALETRTNAVAVPSQQREQQGTSHHLLRGISNYDSRDSGPSASNASQTQADVRLSTQLPSIRAPPVASVSRSVHFVDAAATTAPAGITRRSTTDTNTMSGTTRSAAGERSGNPIRHNWRQPLSLRSSTTQPATQPFDEIFAEVEAEFAQRDRLSGTGEQPSGTRDFLRNLSNQRRQGEAASADSPQPDERRSAIRTQIDQYLAEVESLRQHILQPDPSPPRSGFALQDSSNTRLPDIAGLRARASGDSSPFGSGLFGDSSTSTGDTPRAGTSGSSRVSLPPFLSRTLRTRGLFAHREGAAGIGSDPRDWMGDSEIDLSYESLMAISERLGDVRRRGATDTALASGLTIYKYASAANTGADGETRCAICLEDYEESDDIARSNKCNHALHNNCFTTWLRRVTTCPICRQEAV